ncbi:MAG TPA: parallel beta-helix domain-containing protein [Gemmatimonadales bacterium]|nr:parallel beta-helix domain-containing protein [Gemmatimonadales bacterium]
MFRHFPLPLPLLALTMAVIAACDTPTDPQPLAPSPVADRVAAAGVLVNPGGSIQAAIDAAAPGTVIRIAPGSYTEALTIKKPNLTLLGLGGGAGGDDPASGVVLQNPGHQEDGITVTAAGSGVAIRDLTVRGFGSNGVHLDGVDGFRLSGITAQDDGEYGLFPVRSSHGVIEGCHVSGHSDTGIYVGQSRDVAILGNVTFANVNGIEIENSSDVRAIANETYDNTAGILVVVLPGLDVKATAHILIAGNRVHDNNHANFGNPQDIVAVVPPGSGILVVGADTVSVVGNAVTGNHFVGIGLGSSLTLGALAGLPPSAFADIDPDPDGVRVVGNRVTGNGGASPIPFLPAVDLLWDGRGTSDCWQGNTFGTSAPAPLPACR